MLNEHGVATECTTSNFYIVKDGIVKTPSLDSGILSGITRDFLFKIAPNEKIPLEEIEMTLDDIQTADEAFMSGTIKGVVPVGEIIGRVNWKAPVGSVTEKLRRAYDSYIGLSD